MVYSPLPLPCQRHLLPQTGSTAGGALFQPLGFRPLCSQILSPRAAYRFSDSLKKLFVRKLFSQVDARAGLSHSLSGTAGAAAGEKDDDEEEDDGLCICTRRGGSSEAQAQWRTRLLAEEMEGARVVVGETTTGGRVGLLGIAEG